MLWNKKDFFLLTFVSIAHWLWPCRLHPVTQPEGAGMFGVRTEERGSTIVPRDDPEGFSSELAHVTDQSKSHGQS